MIELRGVSRTYARGAGDVRALEDVSLEIGRGGFVAVVGPSGSGKSTLMNILGLLDRPTGGTYRLDGQEVGSLSDDERAELRNARIGFVFQAFHLLPGTTALENVELPLLYSEHSDIRGLGTAALRQVGLDDRSDHTPGELSGGQQQRVAIARALVNQPDLILADEPTGNLDAAAGAGVLALLRDLNRKGTTVILVTHDPAIAAAADRIVQVVDGRIVADGGQP